MNKFKKYEEASTKLMESAILYERAQTKVAKELHKATMKEACTELSEAEKELRN